MTTLIEIEKNISSLPKNDYKSFRKWFYHHDWKLWDKQFEEDSKAGNLDFLIEEAHSEKNAGKLRKL